MEGSRFHSTQKPGEAMSSNHLTEENHAVDETSRTQPPPSAAGDRAPGKSGA